MNKTHLLIDSHVHIQECYNLLDYFEAVFKNFSNTVLKFNISDNWVGVLYLTEVQKIDFFQKLYSGELKENLVSGGFNISRTSESESIIVSNQSGKKLIVIAGKQIIVKNNIEVLALGTVNNIEDGLDLDETITKVNETGAIPVLPWGVGKWLGRRKEIIQKYVTENSSEIFFLGDNSGRPSFWPKPNLFNLAISSNHFVLPGSDALAIPSEFNKTGSYGLFMECEIDLDKPAETLKQAILNLNKQPTTFGKLENSVKFFINQVKMQLKKHTK